MVARVKVDVATRSDGERVIPKLVAHRGASRRRGFKFKSRGDVCVIQSRFMA